ncbi:hypothetical protein ACIA5D_14760 [Actinoplanes sp. NPDC051513]|uniref:hypothetical protein n=1 Tax=Actinoplanes sp. NPDC051513 TaxID=3363908 RepID=UPI0037A0C454
MRRPVMYLAGLLLATGASLALAGPATAAPSHDHHNRHCHHNHDGWDGGGWGEPNFGYQYSNETNINSNNSWKLIDLGLLNLGGWGDDNVVPQ